MGARRKAVDQREELSAEAAMNAHLQQQLSLSDSDLCSIPYTLSRSELGLLLVELHQAARLQQSGHRNLGVEASLRLILWNLRFHTISRQSLKELRLVELILKFRHHPNRMIEIAARQLLACGIWFAAYREAIGDPLPFMPDGATGPKQKKAKKPPKASPPKRMSRAQAGVASPLGSAQPSSASEHSHPTSAARFSTSSAEASADRVQEGADSAEQQAEGPPAAADDTWHQSQPLRPIARSGGSLEPSTLEELGHARPSHVGDKRSGQVAFDSPSEDFHLASKAARVTPSRSPHRPNKKQKNISLASLGTRHNADGQPAPWQEEIEESRAALRASLGPTESARPPSGTLPQQPELEASGHAHAPDHEEGAGAHGADGQLSPTGSHPSAALGLDAGSRPMANQPASLHRPVAMRLAPPDLMAQLSQQLPVPSSAEQAVRHVQPECNPEQAGSGRRVGSAQSPEKVVHQAPRPEQRAEQQQQHLQHEVTLRSWEPSAAEPEAVAGHRSAQQGTEHKATGPGVAVSRPQAYGQSSQGPMWNPRTAAALPHHASHPHATVQQHPWQATTPLERHQQPRSRPSSHHSHHPHPTLRPSSHAEPFPHSQPAHHSQLADSKQPSLSQLYPVSPYQPERRHSPGSHDRPHHSSQSHQQHAQSSQAHQDHYGHSSRAQHGQDMSRQQHNHQQQQASAAAAMDTASLTELQQQQHSEQLGSAMSAANSIAELLLMAQQQQRQGPSHPQPHHQPQQPPSAAAMKLVSMALANQQQQQRQSQPAAAHEAALAATPAAAQVAALLTALQQQKLPPGSFTDLLQQQAAQTQGPGQQHQQQQGAIVYSSKQAQQGEQHSSAASSYLTGSPASLGARPHTAPSHPTAHPSSLAQHMYGLPMTSKSMHGDLAAPNARLGMGQHDTPHSLLAANDDAYWQSRDMQQLEPSALALAQKTLNLDPFLEPGLSDRSPLQQLQAALASNGSDGCSEQTLSLLTGLPFAEGLLSSEGLPDVPP